MRGTMPERRYAVNPPSGTPGGDFSVPQGLVLLRQLLRLGLPRGLRGVLALDGGGFAGHTGTRHMTGPLFARRV